MASKFLSEDGVRRLWAAIEAKFVDGDEIASLLAEVQPGETMIAMTDEDIDAVTGYVAPVETPEEEENPEGGDN